MVRDTWPALAMAEVRKACGEGEVHGVLRSG